MPLKVCADESRQGIERRRHILSSCHNLVTVLAALLVMSSHSLSELFCARFVDEETKAWRIVLHGHGHAANRSWEL